MNVKRIIARIAAVAVVSGTIALASGAPPALADELSTASTTNAAAPAPTSTADELSQLRTNQQLLQQRLDQLEQIAQVGPAHPQEPPGTVSLAGSFPRSFLIPGTDTSINVGGQIDFDAGYWFTGGTPNVSNTVVPSLYGVPYTATIPLDVPGNVARARSNGVLGATVYNSRLHIETRTPTAFGEADTVLEIDFLGCATGGIDCSNANGGTDSLMPRLRLAYGTLGPYLAGQNWGVGFDLAAQPELLDTGGAEGAYGDVRVPQVTYTWQLPTMVGPSSLQVGLQEPEDSAETPQGGTLASDTTLSTVSGETSATTNAGVVGGPNGNQALSVNPLKTTWPDIASALTWQQPWGHLQLHGVVHEAQLEDGSFISQDYVGYGGGVSGNVQPGWLGWSKDNLGFQAYDGNGLGRYSEGGGAGTFFPYLATNFGAPASALGAAVGNPCGYGHAAVAPTAACAAGIRAETIPEFGAEINYQHWWSPTIRSTVDFGFAHEQVPTSLLGPLALTGASAMNKEVEAAHANLIWSPVPFINTGFEFIWGHRQTVYNQRGDQQLIDYTFLIKF
jgi:hypothetical protein